MMLDFDRTYSSHMCKLYYDEYGNKLKNSITRQYDLMTGEKNDEEHKGFLYIGKGECVSCFDDKTGKTIKINGEGHFWSRIN